MRGCATRTSRFFRQAPQITEARVVKILSRTEKTEYRGSARLLCRNSRPATSLIVGDFEVIANVHFLCSHGTAIGNLTGSRACDLVAKQIEVIKADADLLKTVRSIRSEKTRCPPKGESRDFEPF